MFSALRHDAINYIPLQGVAKRIDTSRAQAKKHESVLVREVAKVMVVWNFMLCELCCFRDGRDPKE